MMISLQSLIKKQLISLSLDFGNQPNTERVEQPQRLGKDALLKYNFKNIQLSKTNTKTVITELFKIRDYLPHNI